VNLLVLGTSNRGILQAPNIFRYAESLETKFGVSDYKPFISLQIFGILFLIALLLFLFFKTIYGLKLRALGDNTELAEESGIKITFYYIFGLSLTNFLAGISGVITAQIQGFTDIHMGQGLLIVALAALILGEAIIPVGCSDVARVILSSVIGSILYYFLALTVITLGINATYIKFLTAVLVLFAAASGKKLVPKEEPHTHEY
jgi:putative ABC transport system permease protein